MGTRRGQRRATGGHWRAPPDSREGERPPAAVNDARRAGVLFVATAGCAMAAYYLLAATEFYEGSVQGPWTAATAQLSAAVLRMFGSGVSADGSRIVSTSLSLGVRRGCDALEPIALFVSVTLAFPAPWKARLRGAALGVLVLSASNVVRVISLYWIAVHWRGAFAFFHVEVWQGLLLVIAIVAWLAWARGAMAVRAGGELA